jgi:hypothetical protein
MASYDTDRQTHAHNPNTSSLSHQYNRVVASGGIGRELHYLTTNGADDQVVVLVADMTIAYAGQRTSPTTISICVYAGVSVIPYVKG